MDISEPSTRTSAKMGFESKATAEHAQFFLVGGRLLPRATCSDGAWHGMSLSVFACRAWYIVRRDAST